MLLLAIDTAGPDCAVAIARQERDGAEILAEASEQIGRGHAERLMPMIEEALGRAAIGFADLDRVAVTVGPGSFTGVRVGIAAARGLALALDIPAVGVGSLEALAAPASRNESVGTVVAALDAKRGEVFLLARDLASGSALMDASAVPINAIATRLLHARRPLLLAGSGAAIVAQATCGEAHILSTATSPKIGEVAELGLLAKEGAPPAPLYVRGADAKPQSRPVLVQQ